MEVLELNVTVMVELGFAVVLPVELDVAALVELDVVPVVPVMSHATDSRCISAGVTFLSKDRRFSTISHSTASLCVSALASVVPSTMDG